MNALVVCVSQAHGNTRKVAEAMAQVLEATVVEPEALQDASVLSEYDLIGFGSGIFYGFFHKRLRRFIRDLPSIEKRPAFLFFTNGVRVKPYMAMLDVLVAQMKGQLASKGFVVVDDVFSCAGWSTWLMFALIGGISKGRPNEDDLEQAGEFARNLLKKADETAPQQDETPMRIRRPA
jgi:flavodoxin